MALAKLPDIKEQMVLKYIPLVKYIASRVIIGKSKYIEYEELVSCGMVGLMDAINKFDKSKGMKFSTYASIRIKGAMIDELRKNSPISKGAMDKLTLFNETLEKLQKKFLREPTYEEIAKELKIPIKEVFEIENYINYISVISLEDLIFSDDDDIQLIGIIEDEKSPNPEKLTEEKEKKEYLERALENLKEKDKIVYENLTLKEIGKVLEVSESRVCQLHSRAIINLRKELKKLKYT